MNEVKNKEAIRTKIKGKTKPILLSAQDYDALTDKEKGYLTEIAEEEGFDDYEKDMKKLWPRKVVFNTKWRNK